MYTKVALFGRYDRLDPDDDTSDDDIKTTIAGVSYKIKGDNYLVVAFEKTEDDTRPKDDKKGQIVLQIAF